jgi:DnaJ-domain-containing protein 1
MEIGWSEVIIIVILLFISSTIFRRIIRKTYHEFIEAYKAEDNPSNNARQSSTDSSPKNYQDHHNNDDQTSMSMEREEQDPYRILNIHHTSTQSEITSAYRKLAQLYHPDKVAGLAPEYKEIAARNIKIINKSYQTFKK